MDWDVLDSGECSSAENMALDREFFLGLEGRQRPLLHFYEWKRRSATYGCLVHPEHYLDLAAIESEGIDLAMRPTGGGVLFHLWDFAFSALVPASSRLFSENTLENYALINRAVLRAVERLCPALKGLYLGMEETSAMDASCKRFCMAHPTRYDVLYQGKKVVGAAQRKGRFGFLHQGTIALVMPEEGLLAKLLLPGTSVLQAMMQTTHPVLGDEPVDVAKRELKRLIYENL